jgi:hypothetical protein
MTNPARRYASDEPSITVLARRYRAIVNDPILAHFRMCMKASGMTYRQISVKCGVSTSCLRSWDDGKTKRPQHITLEFVFRAMGYRLPPPTRI